MIRNFCVFILAAFIMSGILVEAYSADIDGVDNGVEWDGATAYVFIDGESNCGVDFGVMKLILDNENKAVFFCFLLIDPELESDNVQTGITLSIDNSEPFVFTAGSSSVAYDADKYIIDGSISVDSNNGATCEVRLGMKSGLPRRINGCVRFIDSSGLLSNEYKFSVVNEEYADLTASELRPTADNRDPAYNPAQLTEKTTKTKNATTKKTTTKKTTTTQSSYEPDGKKETSRKRTTTTRVGYTTQEFVINTSPPYSYERTTKKQQTQLEQTFSQAESKTKVKNKTTDAVTIYYYEKEIIVSEIYKEEKTDLVNNIPEYVESETCTTSDMTQETVGILTHEEEETELTDGKKYKYIIGAVSATAIILLAAWASKGNKNKESYSNDN